MLLAACSPLALDNGLTPSETYIKAEGIAYGEDIRQQLDIYRPEKMHEIAEGRISEKMPVVVFFYGGSWNSGQRSDYAFVGESLAAQGIGRSLLIIESIRKSNILDLLKILHRRLRGFFSILASMVVILLGYL